MLATAQIGPARKPLQQAMTALSSAFGPAAGTQIHVPHLFPAEQLLDVYGEDLRNRAFLFNDPVARTELCLRPDFTVPVALAHGAAGWGHEASYNYAGAVFRRQDALTSRPVEIMQTGVEVFGRRDTIAADAGIFDLMYRGLQSVGIVSPKATIGDLGIVFAVLDALEMPAALRRALKRHVWRPARFQSLIARACNPAQPSSLRAEVIALAEAPDAMRDRATGTDGGDEVGQRSMADITARAQELSREATEPKLAAADAGLIGEILAVSGPVATVTDQLARATRAAGIDISATLQRLSARHDAIVASGVPSEALWFDAAFGRTLEYYDGFVFELRATDKTGHPPLSGGGRYDAMTTRLGAAEPVPAVGAMIRPEAVLEVLR